MPIPLAVYIHVPFCKQRCSYCSFVSYSGRENDIPSYVDAIIHEIELRKISDALITTIYFGGGTPSLLPVISLQQILNTLKHHYHFSEDTEVTLEANPATVDFAYLNSLRQIGINRLSLGVQSLDEAELKLLGRIHTVYEARTAIIQAQQAGFDNISLDFIYGIPMRNTKQWENTLKTIPKLGIHHVSLYGLTVEEGTLLHERIKCGELAAPDSDAAATEYETASSILAQYGFNQYEISNWALPGYESRHNTAYWLRAQYIGLGVAAHSFLDNNRIANTSSLDDYISHLSQGHQAPLTSETIDQATAVAESIILGLRLNKGISSDDIQARFGIDLYSHFAQHVEECISLELLERRGNVLRLTQRGRLLGNEVFWRFLP